MSRKAKAMPYEVQHNCGIGGWQNTWLLDEEPHIFATKAEAQAELDEFLADIETEIASGERAPDEGYDRDEFCIVEVGV